jgi:hypothetical protein
LAQARLTLLVPRFIPDLNSNRNDEGQARYADPAKNNACDGHPFAQDPCRVAADLSEREVSEEKSRDRAQAAKPKDPTDEAADGLPACA